MKLSSRGGLTIFVAAVVVIVTWRLWPREEINPEAESKPKAAAVERSSLPVAAKTAEKPLPEWGTPEFNKTILERCAKWVESRGRDAASLVAMWDLAGEESLLLEAAEKFPDDPRVCVAMIGHLTAKGGDALPWAERMIENEPKNPAGHYWRATLLGKAGKPEEALAALREGTEVKGKFAR